jgi:Arc/MetJ family transcription regulator
VWAGRGACYAVCMKRTNVVLDEHLLDEAVRVSGEPTYSKTIERALEEMVQRAKARHIDLLAGSGLWAGSLSEMRGDITPVVARESRGVYRARKRRVAR